MSIVELIVISFLMVGFAVLGIAFWAAYYPKLLCKKSQNPKESENNVCIRSRGHEGPHMNVNGRKFREK